MISFIKVRNQSTFFVTLTNFNLIINEFKAIKTQVGHVLITQFEIL